MFHDKKRAPEMKGSAQIPKIPNSLPAGTDRLPHDILPFLRMSPEMN